MRGLGPSHCAPPLFSPPLTRFSTKCNSLPLRRANARRAPRARSLTFMSHAATTWCETRRATSAVRGGSASAGSLVLHESWLSVRIVSSNCAQMHPNTDTTNKAGLIYSRISQVTRIQCELSGRRDSGTALAVVFVYTRSGYVSGHVVVAVVSRGDCGAASSLSPAFDEGKMLLSGSVDPGSVRCDQAL